MSKSKFRRQSWLKSSNMDADKNKDHAKINSQCDNENDAAVCYQM
jgi:hypothetical protein